MKKLTKDQRYYRKKKKDGSRDFRKTIREDGREGVRVTRRPLCVKISQAAFERLVVMAEYSEIKNWEMLTRIILKGLPKYSYYSDSMSPTNRYQWQTIASPDQIKYKGSEGDKQITYDITSTASHKLEQHKKATGLSKARIIQSLVLNYKPLSKAKLESNRRRHAEMMEKYGMYNQKNSTVEKEYKRSKFINSGGEIVHKKGIPIEHWDEAEFEEHEKLYKEMLEKRAKREQEKKEYYESFDQDDMVTEEIIQAAIKRYQEQQKASD